MPTGTPADEEPPITQDDVMGAAVRNLRSLILAGEYYRQAVSDAIGLGTTETQALSYLAVNGESGQSVLDRPIHVHVPAGAVPKDGPSAGVTMVTALTSMATGRPVRGEVGMTGEVTLNGRVLPIGGLKQKLLAAQRAGLTTVFAPARNAPDLDEVPAEVTDAVEVVLTTDVAELVVAALEPAVDVAGRTVAAAA